MMTTTTAPTGWYVIFPGGSAWVAVRLDKFGRLTDCVGQANAETHMRAGDRSAPICRAIADEQRTDANVTADQAAQVIGAWYPYALPEDAVVERIVGLDD